jgi:hypothetical protein
MSGYYGGGGGFSLQYQSLHFNQVKIVIQMPQNVKDKTK